MWLDFLNIKRLRNFFFDRSNPYSFYNRDTDGQNSGFRSHHQSFCRKHSYVDLGNFSRRYSGNNQCLQYSDSNTSISNALKSNQHSFCSNTGINSLHGNQSFCNKNYQVGFLDF